MSREVKRVDKAFRWFEDHPGETWDGYVNPHGERCPDCDGPGITAASEWLTAIVQLLLTAGEAAVSDRLHPWLRDLPNAPRRYPTRELAELTEGLSGRSPDRFLGHDALDKYRAQNAIVEAAGLKAEEWGLCVTCEGSGLHPDHRAAFEAWQPTEPPEGDGWQMWETTSDGSPISPVFDTPEELAEWLAESGASAFGSDTARYEQWLAMIRGPGWAVSAVMDAGGLRSGVEAGGEP